MYFSNLLQFYKWCDYFQPTFHQQITAINNKSVNIFTIVYSESVKSDIFPLNGYLPLMRKDSATHILGLVVLVKDGLPFVRDNLLEILDDR